MRTDFIHRMISRVVSALAVLFLSASAYGQILNEVQKLLASDGTADDWFGQSVSVSGDVAVIGAVTDDDNGYRSGSAYVFRWSPGAPGSWIQASKLLPSDGAERDFFGRSVSVSGDVAVVGAYGDDDNGNVSGSAYVFRWNGSSWAQEQKLLPSDGAEADRFGYSVSVSGDVAVVGAYGDDDMGSGSGSAYVFRWNPDLRGWVQEQKLLASDGAAGDVFGWSVSVSGDVVVVGAPSDYDNGPDSGSGYVFRWNGSSWVQEHKLLAADGARFDEFGWSVSASGTVAVVGSWGNDDNGTDSGSAYVFRRTDFSWVQEQKLLSSDGAAGYELGYSVSVSGDVVVVGAYFVDDNSVVLFGLAYVFRWNPGVPGSWVQVQKLLASDGVADDDFGFSVSVAGNVAVVGAPFDDDNDMNSGSAYVFYLSCDPGYYGPMCLECPGGASDPCNGHGVCDDGIDGTGACSCGFGWTGADCGTDVDECALGTDDCDVNGTCTNTPGGFICTCDSGWTELDCGTDVDECALGTDNCDDNATCTNTPGSFICTCNPDYAGDGVTCALEAIPTVSAWGLTVLTLLLLAGAKVRFSRSTRPKIA